MKLISDPSGIAWGYTMILVAVVFAGVMWSILSVSVNEMTESMNEELATGEISEQTYTSYNWSVRTFIWLAPLGCLASFVVWGFTRANMRGDD
jgi:hypothetical protein